jgi:hypothetical protein
MMPQAHTMYEEFDALITDAEKVEQAPEDDLWLSRLVPDFN